LFRVYHRRMWRLSGALLVSVGGCALLSACTPPNDGGASSATSPSSWSDGISDGATSSAQNATSATSHGGRWEHADELSNFRIASPRVRSIHFAGEYDADVRTNQAASAYPSLGPAQALATGAIVVETLRRPASEAVVVYLVMSKIRSADENSAWEYLVLNPSSEIEQRGALPLCERCHTEAPHDHLYGRAP
jgi:hypothetical protein